VTALAYGRPFWPLFLHVLGAMTLVGGMLAVLVVTVTAWRRPETVSLRRAALLTLLVVAIPAWVVMRVGAQWIYSNEGFSGHDDPTWVGIGFIVADLGLVVLLVTSGIAFWWDRAGNSVAGRLVGGLSGLYLVLLAVAWLAMSGKWT
jgi:hypothetical protein